MPGLLRLAVQQVWLANQPAHHPDWLSRQLVKKLPLARGCTNRIFISRVAVGGVFSPAGRQGPPRPFRQG